jgi:hypothetical protein
MKTLIILICSSQVLLFSTSAIAVVLYGQPPVDPASWPPTLSTEGKSYNPGVYQASGNGMDYDKFVWDNFTLSSNQAIIRIDWRGGYDPYVEFGGYGYSHGYGVVDFSISIWGTIAGQPDIGTGPMVLYDYDTGILTAGETLVGTFGGGLYGPTMIFDYSYVLPTPLTLTAGTQYWIKIEAFQAGVPDWGLAVGSGQDNQHFASFVNYAGGTSYQFSSGDVTFSLIGVDPACGDWGYYAADIDQNCQVDFADFARLAQWWLSNGCATSQWCNGADLGKNDSVNMLDLAQMASEWLNCTNPQDSGCTKL